MQGNLVDKAPPRLDLLAFATFEGGVRVAARSALGGERHNGVCAGHTLKAVATQVVDEQTPCPQPFVRTHTPQEIVIRQHWRDGCI